MQKKIKARSVSMIQLRIKDQEWQLSPRDFAVLKAEINKVERTAFFSRCVRIRDRVSKAFRIDPKLLHLQTRVREISEPRQISSYFMVVDGIPTVEVAKFFGFHRTAADHAFRSITDRMETDKEFSALVNRIAESLK